MIHQFKDRTNVPATVSADATVKQLLDIKDRHGELTGQTIAHDVESDPENHELRWWFTWDTDAGMHKLHVIEAGQLVRLVVIADAGPGHKEPVRAFVTVVDEDDDISARYEARRVIAVPSPSPSHDTGVSLATSNYFAQLEGDDTIRNAVRSALPLRTDDPPVATAPPPVYMRPTHNVFSWENRDDDEGLLVKMDTRDSLVQAVLPKDKEQAGVTLAPISPRYVADPTLADMTVLLRNHLTPLLRLLAWASSQEMTVPQLHDEIKALYVS